MSIMRKTFLLLFFIIILLTGVYVIFFYLQLPSRTKNISQMVKDTINATQNSNDVPRLSIVAQNLDVPWAIAFFPDGILVTERKGQIKHISSQGVLDSGPILTIDNVKQVGEGGLHGIALHPDFSNNHFIYVYHTYSSQGNNTLNRVVRYTLQEVSLTNSTIIVDKIPGAPNHDGGRIKFGPDGYLYITTGDAQEPSLAQNKNSLAGKILRVKDDGSAVNDNPFINGGGNPLVYSFGHRNPQGICWDSNGELWETEHGPSGTDSGNDELNKIEKGTNYGWPTIQGNQTRPGMVTPIINSGTADTWAPAGAACVKSSVFFGGLRGNALYEAVIDGSNATLKTHLKGELGRIREVIQGPDGMLYITTSNRDGRGVPSSGDDKILRVNPEKL